MNAIKNLIENIKERIKAAWAEQQESELFVSTKEKFEALPVPAQKAITLSALFFLILLILWWPLSNFLDSVDFNSKFEDRRQTLKELLRIERDLASQPNMPMPPAPSSMKAQFDQKITGAGVKTGQVVDQSEMPPQSINGAQQRGFQYHINHLTIRQALDLSYELEHTDPSFKLAGLELIAEPQDPHFYGVSIRVVSFAPKSQKLKLPEKDSLTP